MEQVIDYKKVITYKDFYDIKSLEEFQIESDIDIIKIESISVEGFRAPFGSDGYGKNEKYTYYATRLFYSYKYEVKEKIILKDLAGISKEWQPYDKSLELTPDVLYDVICYDNFKYNNCKIKDGYFISDKGQGTHFLSVVKIKTSN